MEANLYLLRRSALTHQVHRVGLMRALLFGCPQLISQTHLDRLLTIPVPLRQLLDHIDLHSQSLPHKRPAASFANTCNDFSQLLAPPPPPSTPLQNIFSRLFPSQRLLYPFTGPPDSTVMPTPDRTRVPVPWGSSHVPSKNTVPLDVEQWRKMQEYRA